MAEHCAIPLFFTASSELLDLQRQVTRLDGPIVLSDSKIYVNFNVLFPFFSSMGKNGGGGSYDLA